MTPYGDIDLIQQWLWLAALTNVDLSSARICGTYQRQISEEVLKASTREMRKYTCMITSTFLRSQRVNIHFVQ